RDLHDQLRVARRRQLVPEERASEMVVPGVGGGRHLPLNTALQVLHVHGGIPPCSVRLGDRALSALALAIGVLTRVRCRSALDVGTFVKHVYGVTRTSKTANCPLAIAANAR